MRSTLQLIPRLWVAAALSLWTLDVTVHLGLVEGLVIGPALPSGWRDFAGLMAADLLPALLLVLLSAAAAWITGRWLPGRDRRRELVSCVAGATAGLSVLVTLRLSWGLHISDLGALLLAAVAGAAVWWVFRTGTRQSSDPAWTLTGLVGWILLPSLLLAFGVRAVSLLVGGDWGRGAVAAVATLVAAAMVRVCCRRSGSRRVAGIGWLAPLLALLLALRVVALSAWPGRDPDLGASTKNAQRPDVVLIVLDTVRADHLQRYGYDRNTMPALERWSDHATVARRALSAAGWTSPSHASIFSGLPVSLHGVHFASGRSAALGTSPIEGIDWLPQRLADFGYYRLAVSANPRAVPEVGGFSRVIAPERYGWQLSTLGSLFDRKSSLLERLNSRLRWQTPYIDAREVTDLVEAAMPRGDGPIFLFVNFLDAHSPYNPPQVALDRLGLTPGNSIHRYALHRDLTKSWEHLPSTRSQDLADLYDGELNGLDSQLARLLEWIDRRLGADTTVIVTADHGEELGEDGRVGHEFGLAQRLIHVPLMIRSPLMAAGAVEEIVDIRHLYDFILATATGEGGAESLLHEDAYGHLAERYPTEHNVRSIGPGYDRPWVSLIAGDVKVVGPSAQGLEILKLDSDDFSRQSPASSAALGAELGRRIDDYWDSHRDRREESTDSAAPSEEELKVLRSLGYVP